MDKNTVSITIGSILGIFAFLFAAYYFTTPRTVTLSEETVRSLTTVLANDHVKWATESANILVEYSDIQCPACKMMHEYLSNIPVSTDAGTFNPTRNMKLVYRHFPLNIHQNAESAAFATEAANKQGKFFEMLDVLFENQDQWSKENNPRPLFEQYASDLKLNVEQFAKDMDSDNVRDIVNTHRQLGIDARVDGTPAFFLNGKKLEGFSSFEEFNKLLEDSLNGSSGK